jgi:hypothetical protein
MATSIVNFILNSGPKPPPGWQAEVRGESSSASVKTAGQGFRNSVGVTVSSGGVMGYHMRFRATPHRRLYAGFWYWSKKGEFGDRDWEFHLPAFVEWHTNNSPFNVYGGLGGALGFYNYPHHYYEDILAGFLFGVQGGMELRFGWFLIGCDIRLAYYMRGVYGPREESGGIGSIGIRTGVQF